MKKITRCSRKSGMVSPVLIIKTLALMMRSDPTIQDENKDTPAMHWIIYVQTDPPEWMRHDPKIPHLKID